MQLHLHISICGDRLYISYIHWEGSTISGGDAERDNNNVGVHTIMITFVATCITKINCSVCIYILQALNQKSYNKLQ